MEPSTEMWLDRLVVEHKELHEKVLKLVQFMATAAFAELDDEDRILLKCQRDGMLKYFDVLGDRLKRAGALR